MIGPETNKNLAKLQFNQIESSAMMAQSRSEPPPDMTKIMVNYLGGLCSWHRLEIVSDLPRQLYT